MFRLNVVNARLTELGARSHGFKFESLVLCGMRGVLPVANDPIHIKRVPDDPDRFNDCLFVAGGLSDGVAFAATMDPGRYWVESKQGGAARIEPGVYLYGVGTHPDYVLENGTRVKKQFPALNQISKVRIRRDVDRDYVWEETEPVQEGVFAISIHWGYGKRDDYVGSTSAGCTALHSLRTGWPWQNFWAMIVAATTKGQKRFPYWVLTEQEVQEVFRA